MSGRAIEASMLIRRPPGEVFAAFVNPMMLRKFWLSDASGPLAPGARVKWKFMVPGVEDDVVVRRFESPSHLAFDWSDGISVEMTFELIDSGATHVRVAVSGFAGEGMLEQATGTIEGFSIVLCDLKTLLESGTSANLVRDKAELITRSIAASK
ncbi:MAG TPA: SRPBCC domain-containing protein [Steroidobacteraceae bacterium]|nr:SRPBCC domain-containing protein [Steroidobacteraceae bacterium]